MRFLILFIFLSSECFGATYYFSSSTGNDSRTSTQAQSSATPWKTLAKLNSITLAPGDFVNLKRGDVFDGFIAAQSGNASNYISYSPYGTGANPIINGFTTLTFWHLLSGHIYYADSVQVPAVRTVTMDGLVQKIGRYPNTGYMTYTSNNSIPDDPATTGIDEFRLATSISSSAFSSLPSSFIGGEIVIKKQRYILDRHIITAKSGTTISYASYNHYGYNNTYNPDNGNGCIIQSHLATLDQEGEWYFDSTAKRLYMHFGTGTPTGRTVKVATVSSLALVYGQSYVNFTDLVFLGGNRGMDIQSSHDILINFCDFMQEADGIYANFSTHVEVNACNISDCSNNGIWADDNDTNIWVNGSIVKNSGTVVGAGMSGDATYNGILVVGDGTIIVNSTIQNSGFNGIYFDGSEITIEHNRVDSCCSIKDDGGLIYTFTNAGLARTNRKINENIVTNVVGAPEGSGADPDAFGKGAGIYLDGNSNHTVVTNNICATGWAGIFVLGNSDNRIDGNIFYDFTAQLLLYIKDTIPGASGTVKNDTIINNKFIARTASQETMSINIFNKPYNPKLIGPMNSNTYARPISEGNTIDVHYWYFGQNTPNLMSVATFKNTYNQDLASQASQVTTTNVNNMQLQFNSGASLSGIGLGAVYKNVQASKFTGTAMFNAFGGDVLIYDSPLPATTLKVAKSLANKVYLKSGKLAVITD